MNKSTDTVLSALEAAIKKGVNLHGTKITIDEKAYKELVAKDFLAPEITFDVFKKALSELVREDYFKPVPRPRPQYSVNKVYLKQLGVTIKKIGKKKEPPKQPTTPPQHTPPQQGQPSKK